MIFFSILKSHDLKVCVSQVIAEGGFKLGRGRGVEDDGEYNTCHMWGDVLKGDLKIKLVVLSIKWLARNNARSSIPFRQSKH